MGGRSFPCRVNAIVPTAHFLMDNVLFIYRPNVQASDQAEIIVARQQNGSVHPGIPRRFRSAQTNFQTVTQTNQ